MSRTGVYSVAGIPGTTAEWQGGLNQARREFSLGGAHEEYFASVGYWCGDCSWCWERAGKGARESAGETSGDAGGSHDCGSGSNSRDSFIGDGSGKKRKSREIVAGSAGCREEDFWI